MTLKPKDPLLAAARIVLIVIMAAMVLAIAACGIAVLAMLVAHGRVVTELAAHGAPEPASWVILGLVVLAACLAALGFVFFRNLHRIVGSVGTGDPFIPENARRLSAMGWIVVAVHVVAFPLVGLGAWLARHFEHANADMSITSANDILLALILFILARVFREGTRLRDELEGTV